MREKIIRNAAVRGVYNRPQFKIKNIKDRELFILNNSQETEEKELFTLNTGRQKPASPEVHNAFEVIVKSIFIEQANSADNSPANTKLKILELIRILSNSEKDNVQEFRVTLIKSFNSAINACEGKLPGTAYKTLELILHDIDVLLENTN